MRGKLSEESLSLKLPLQKTFDQLGVAGSAGVSPAFYLITTHNLRICL